MTSLLCSLMLPAWSLFAVALATPGMKETARDKGSGLWLCHLLVMTLDKSLILWVLVSSPGKKWANGMCLRCSCRKFRWDSPFGKKGLWKWWLYFHLITVMHESQFLGEILSPLRAGILLSIISCSQTPGHRDVAKRSWVVQSGCMASVPRASYYLAGDLIFWNLSFMIHNKICQVNSIDHMS